MAFIQATHYSVASGNGTPALTGVGAGHALYLLIDDNQAGTATFTPTDSVNGALTQVGSYTSAIDNTRFSAWKIENVSSGSHTVTVVPSVSGAHGGWLVEVSTVASGSNDGEAGQALGSPGSGANAITSGNFTTTVANDLILTMCGDVNGLTTFHAGSNLTYTTVGSFVDSAGGDTMTLAYATAPSAGTNAGQWTDSTNGGSDNYVVIAVAIQPIGPSITSQPTNQYVTPGNSVTFSVTGVSSGGSLTYQWYNEQGSIVGATSSTYSFTPNYPTDATNSWYVIVTDSNGSVTSNTVEVIFTVSTNPRKRYPPPFTDPADQDYLSELTLIRWF